MFCDEAAAPRRHCGRTATAGSVTAPARRGCCAVTVAPGNLAACWTRVAHVPACAPNQATKPTRPATVVAAAGRVCCRRSRSSAPSFLVGRQDGEAAPGHVGAGDAVGPRRIGVAEAAADVACLVADARGAVRVDCEGRAVEEPEADGAVVPEEDLVGGHVGAEFHLGQVPGGVFSGAVAVVAIGEGDVVVERVGDAGAVGLVEREVEAGRDLFVVADDAAVPVVLGAVGFALEVDDVALAVGVLAEHDDAGFAVRGQGEGDGGLHRDDFDFVFVGLVETGAHPVVFVLAASGALEVGAELLGDGAVFLDVR